MQVKMPLTLPPLRGGPHPLPAARGEGNNYGFKITRPTTLPAFSSSSAS
jgi:hypothetical protein